MEEEQRSEARNEEMCDQNIERSRAEPDVMSFLRGLKLEEYYDAIIEHGGDKLGQLVYVDDASIDQLCRTVNMRLIHAGVFKRAIRDCRASTKNSSYENQDRVNMLRLEQQAAYLNHYNHNPYTENTYSNIDRRRYIYGSEHHMFHQPPHSHHHAYNTMNSYPDYYNYYGKNIPMSHTEIIQKAIINNDENSKADNDQTNNGDIQFNPINKSSEVTGSGVESLPDGSYYVTIGERVIRFPSSVKRLTHISRIDSPRLEIIKRGSQIYGRDDTKRKNNELTPLEVFMNVVAYEVCLRDFTYMISRQRLLGLVREIVKDNQIQFTANHISQPTAVLTNGIQNGKKEDKPIIVSMVQGLQDLGLSTMIQDEQKNSMSEYDIILHYKMYKEWPMDVKKDKRKYYSRRAASFELVNNVLYYCKDNKKRRYVDTPELKARVFAIGHTNPDSGCHYSREATIDRISKKYYFKNMNSIISDMLMDCEVCQERFRLNAEDNSKRRRNNNSFSNEEVHVVSVLPNEININCSQIETTGVKRPSSNEEVQNPPAKRPRKSIPKKLKTDENGSFFGFQNNSNNESFPFIPFNEVNKKVTIENNGEVISQGTEHTTNSISNSISPDKNKADIN